MTTYRYFLPEYNFSVEQINGQWCMAYRKSGDIVATTSEQIAAVTMWAEINHGKFND